MIHTLNRRADEHRDFCEDAYHWVEKGDWVIAGVFDGCSDGKRSHFASQLHAYIFRKSVEWAWAWWLESNATTIDAETFATGLIISLENQLSLATHSLVLDEQEILSTVVLAIYNKKTKDLLVRFAGDGVVKVNDDIIRVDSGPTNMPKYLAYGINSTKEPELISYNFYNVTSFSICTDGIDQIRSPQRSVEEIVHYLLTNRDMFSSQKMLDRKINILHREGAQLKDDVTIIRYTDETI